MATKDLTEWASVKDSAETQANSGLIHPNLIEARWSEASTLQGIQSVWASRHVTICHDYSLLPRLAEDRISKEPLNPLASSSSTIARPTAIMSATAASIFCSGRCFVG